MAEQIRSLTPSTEVDRQPADRSEVGIKGSRWQMVDLLRGVAVLLVLFRHHPSGGFFNHIGWIGVDLFFVLSGFLVSGLIFDEYRLTRSFDGVRFLIRRGFKIYPSFYALIALSALLKWMLDRHDPIMNHIAEIFFFQNYHEGLWVHTWSLAVEEHFYLLLVGVAAVVIHKKIRLAWHSMLAVCGFIFVGVLFMRMAEASSEPFDVRRHLFPTHLRIDSMLAGVLLAAWHRYRPVSFRTVFNGPYMALIALLLLGLLPVILTNFGSYAMRTYGLSALFFSGAIAVGMAVARKPIGPGSKLTRIVVRPLAWVGGHSYNIYLWHLLVLLVVEMFFARAGANRTMPELLVYVALSLMVGAIMSTMVERPFLGLREKYYPSRSRQSPAALEKGRATSL